jgi:MOSC domain-containing protein YiiM
MRLVSILVGLPRTVGTPGAEDRMERAFTSAIWKAAVARPVRAGALGLDGDAVYDTECHGGFDQAVLMYSAGHYPRWEAELGHPVERGAFGENLLVEGLDEDTVCVGDLYRVGPLRMQVTHPRTPCSTLARRHQIPDMIAMVRRNARSGWYLRVLDEGELEAGQEVLLLDRPNPGWTIRRAAQVMLERQRDPTAAADLARCQGISAEWRDRLLAAARALH